MPNGHSESPRDHADLRDLDAAGLLAAAETAVRDRRLAEVADLEVLAQWAAVHSEVPVDTRPFGNHLVDLGGDGTPGVQDWCLGEIALARGTGVMATSNALADVLDLQHRLPRTWKVCVAGAAEIYVARKVARMSRHLPLEVITIVDAAVSAIIGSESGGRVIEVAEAKIIEADPTLAIQREQEERRKRYVHLSQTDETGLRTIIARVTAGDAHWIDATLTRVAELIQPLHPDASADELRSIALGYLARPAELLQLLVEGQTDTDQIPEQDGLFDPDEPADEPTDPRPSRAHAFPADLLAALRDADLSSLAPKATLYVHLAEDAVNGIPGTARVEGLSPMTLANLQELLLGADITVKPVIDLHDRVRSTAYEHPESLKERVHLITGGDYWPYATSTSRTVDYDHPTAYDSTGPPGQTGTHNSGPLGRRHHRWKTHAGYQARQSGDGRYAWLTPHGLGFLVDHHGTHRIPPRHARMIIDAPEGVDLYPVDRPLALADGYQPAT